MAVPVQTWWIAAISAATVHRLIGLAQNRKPKARAGVLVYEPTLQLKIIFGLGIPLFLVLTILSIVQREGWFLTSLFGFFCVLPIFAWPPAIYVSDDGLQTRTWWSRTMRIPWKEISKVTFRRAGLLTVVVGCHGKKIAHSAFYVDSEGFREQLKRHTTAHRIQTN